MRNVFGFGARAYDFLTSSAPWRAQAAGLLEHASDADGVRSILDLGCGPAMSVLGLASELPAAHIVGLDLVPQMLARARRHCAAFAGRAPSFVQGDGTRLPFADDSFDLVTGHSFLYLVPDQRSVLEEARRVLRPGASLVLMEPRAGGSLRRALPAVLAGGRRDPLGVTRMAAAMILWRIYSQAIGRIDAAWIAQRFGEAGFREVGTAPTLGGLGLHCFGRA